ncbi:MAG: hypothetical protein E4G98_04740 [Promethearchaeota archaeon]|nr:MAG: hypothetical protein E4G98_04740 [Candidatus Lokiarchaeota archaeon]
MSKDEFISILDGSFSEGTPFIDFTENYSYALIPQGGKWLEVSYDFEDHEIIEKRTMEPVDAYNKFCEEIEKALAEVLELFYLNRWKEYKASLSEDEAGKLPKLIAELTGNTAEYGKDIPIITKAEDLSTLKAKL